MNRIGRTNQHCFGHRHGELCPPLYYFFFTPCSMYQCSKIPLAIRQRNCKACKSCQVAWRWSEERPCIYSCNILSLLHFNWFCSRVYLLSEGRYEHDCNRFTFRYLLFFGTSVICVTFLLPFRRIIASAKKRISSNWILMYFPTDILNDGRSLTQLIFRMFLDIQWWKYWELWNMNILRVVKRYSINGERIESCERENRIRINMPPVAIT